ncbi:CPBP family intramembrane glutamic endopeptidase [Ktedonosporobacter rubrisoli]|uniref:CPBP family intramembrane glutamic endopeptidase n=1 Tax=Ktedonosporobacter rubrisoli TaxID=2509675 RepID=UPI0013EE8655|nr:CPBP family intramembrane glutamic endopeptidase [Ktedonosporobacter rubrisoli]
MDQSRLVESMKRHPVVWFFGITLSFTWIYELLIFGILKLPMYYLVPGGYGPTLTAIFLTIMTSGRTGIRNIAQRCLYWRTGWRWYLVVFGSLPALMLLCILLIPAAKAALQMPTYTAALTYIPLFILTLLLFGPLAEEVGWRGFALPLLQQRYGPLVGTVILGGFWGMWHLPLFLFVPGYNGAGADIGSKLLAFFLFVIFCIPLAILFTWVFNGTRGSLLMVIILHTVNNTSPVWLFLGSVPKSIGDGILKYLFTIGLALLAVLLLLMTRGRLRYKRSL